MKLFEGLKQQIAEYLDPAQVELVQQAYIASRDAHEGQTRSSGEPYVTHPVAVTRILADMRLDHEALMAALLHDVIEDTHLTKEDLAEQFNETVAELVEGVSKLDKIQFDSKEEAQAENFQKMVMAMVVDIRVILIKLADRTHNMRTIFALRPDKRRRIARETLEIYAPIANRLGIHDIRNELEDLGFEAMYPMRHRVLGNVVKRERGNRKQITEAIAQDIAGRISEAGIPAKVKGREKHLFSIYQKMRNKELPFTEVMDIYAFRVIVDDVDTCYRVLGLVHSLFKPKLGRFKDYIAIPKANGYQSLHTSLMGPHGVPVEVQIRTEHMDQMADRGVAAHWLYKDESETAGTTAQVRARRWMQSLLELQQSAGSSFEFIESVKSDLFPDEIYCFTPDGRILELPEGATAVDFAYAVHTDVGNACVGARVDRQPHPISQPLATGQTVEIITAKGARPNAAWLNFVVTSRARIKIRQYLKNLKSEEALKLGKRLLTHALGGQKSLQDFEPEIVQQLLQEYKFEHGDELLIDIGLGKIMSPVIAKRLAGDLKLSTKKRKRLPIIGAEGVLTTFGKCCRPIPGDPIIAYMSKDRGLVIHHDQCANVRGYQNEPDKYIAVRWDDEHEQGDEYLTELRVEMMNHQGALATLTSIVANCGSNIQGISSDEKDGRLYSVNLVITTTSRIQLANVMRRIRVMPEVVKVVRNRN
ncbi:bifunctional GTP diphosphokinase/guanosine-3',5'-bis pyrophosphate 3'-pyrophosphohydrolase [Neiella sp. HB171785]|uniref:guanosine-3',5'-bis(diphosphate) 3'-diphosphatase n=1 Tax=Neiella litorisoli TaxID=2771431 RepID=A0A8J6QV93_9GAMM|nr:bifunctional GTP diphosphokinase/guanosine-3',5'-bis pyrophosphate 3'-pyrophosphohydrolase [Neiella litorisoli]MBD1390163.1 bifunctional GTP diphosphokinase/guanosine-3',5'-bis pyrophosphate 3'-pyrophosphohydrolase [Neiella litorisoli]